MEKKFESGCYIFDAIHEEMEKTELERNQQTIVNKLSTKELVSFGQKTIEKSNSSPADF